MNTNEAIEFLCSIQWDGEKAVYNAINAHKLCQLLKQGEAYKTMWKKLGAFPISRIRYNSIEQKYLKEAKQAENNSAEKEEA